MKLIISYLISLNRHLRQLILLFIDVLIIFLSILISFYIVLAKFYWPSNVLENNILPLIFLSPFIAIPIFYYFGLYRSIVRYFNKKGGFTLIKAVLVYSLFWSLLFFIIGIVNVSNLILLINSMVTFLLIGGSRLIIQYLLFITEKKSKNILTKRFLIFGAGEAGRQLASGFSQSFEFHLCAFVDEKKEIQGRELMGLPILKLEQLSDYIRIHRITDILLAIPSISRIEKNRILKLLQPLPLRIRTLPGLSQLLEGRVNVNDIKDLEIDDLLMREVTAPQESLLKKQVNDKIVLVTGAGGSIGKEICIQVFKRSPKILLLLELNEYALYIIHQELLSLSSKIEDKKKFKLPILIPILGSVQDQNILNKIFSKWKPSIIYHTAAYKHVPMVELNLVEGIKNNVLGTLILAKNAIENKVSNFVFISTDKAVKPTNVMGASKRVAEIIIQSIASEVELSFDFLNGDNSDSFVNKTNFSIVRFGNVLNSSGSVIPLFQKQIKNGGPITITDMNIERYFMTISEATQLVMQSGAMSDDNHVAEVFVLNMGDPVKIIDLAYRMIQMCGLNVKDKHNPHGDIEIKEIGLRTGEKLYEELLIGNNTHPTEHVKILKANEVFLNWDKLYVKMVSLKKSLDHNDLEKIFDILVELVEGYNPDIKKRNEFY